LQEQVYIWSGRSEAIAPRKLAQANAEDISQWITGLYPQRTYPAVAIGSANGALTHLWAALGIPWLPQTFLIPVARRLDPDEPMQDFEWAKRWARVLLEHNSDVQLHQLFDPNQDRLMIRRMAYFRIKRLVLGPAYEQFIRRTLMPGGTLVLVECGLKWPTTRVDDRHVFQFGALGGATPQEYHQGGERVAEYLARYRSPRRRWEPPAPDAERPEAEWGFEPRLGEDAERFARDNGFRLRRVRFEQPESASPLVADFYQRA
jgi:hypothetical protein